jgi:hypothetical protein
MTDQHNPSTEMDEVEPSAQLDSVDAPSNDETPADNAQDDGSASPKNKDFRPPLSKEARQLSDELAIRLGERNDGPRRQIQTIVRYCGADFALKVFEEAHEVQRNGGIMLPDNSRKRTFGGVFFLLARRNMTEEFLYYCFKDVRRRIDAGLSAKREYEPNPEHVYRPLPQTMYPPFVWAERNAIIQEILQEKGTVSTVKITLIGRPGRVTHSKDMVVTTMEHTLQVQNMPLPKGIPTNIPTTRTPYTVYIGGKQWRKVEDSIKNPEDKLIVEGIGMLDSQTNTIAVFATSVTTKLLQQATRIPKGTIPPGMEHTQKPRAEDDAAPAPAPRPAAPAPAAPRPAAAPSADELETAQKQLAELYQAEDIARGKLDGIKGMPTSQQFGLATSLKELQKIKENIKALKAKYPQLR